MRFLKSCLLLATAILLYDVKGYTQENIKDYFPHHVGDRWQYVTLPEGNLRNTTITRIDTVNADTAYYIYYNYNIMPSWKISLNNSSILYFKPDSTWIPYYKVNVPEDSYWKFDLETPSWMMYKRQDTITVLGYDTVYKEYWVFSGFEPDSSSDLPHASIKAAMGIGKFLEEWEGGSEELIGCVVDGVQYGTLIDGIEGEKKDIIVSDFELTAYPNPFNGQVTVRYYSPQQASISIKAYDLLGREIAILYEGRVSKGRHSVKWEVNHPASSIYYIVLSTKNRIYTHKILLLK